MDTLESQQSTSYCRLFFLFFLLLVLCYSNSFNASWQLDDKPNILTNSAIQISDLSWEQIMQSMHARPGSGGIYRPIPCLTLGLNWYLHQTDVFGYHLVNFFIHLATCWILFLCVRRLLQSGNLKGRYTEDEIYFIAVFSALFWALNPVQTQAVTYIVQRMASLAALFSIASVYFYLIARNSRQSIWRSLYLLIAALFYICAILSKENSAILPLLILVIEWLFFSFGSTKRSYFNYGISFVLISILVIFAGFAVRPEGFDFIFRYYENRPFTLSERLLSEQRIILFYLSQLFFPAPWRLSIEHDITLSTSLITPWSTIAAIIINAGLIIVAIVIRKKQPLAALAILFYYIGHLIESTIVPLELIFEHRNYLPSLFLFVPAAQLLSFILHKTANYRLLNITASILLIVMLIALGYSTYFRNNAWKTEESLWLDAVAKAPNSARPLAVLAIKLAWGTDQSRERDLKAIQLTEKTLSLQMGRKRLDAAQIGNLGSLYNKMGDYETAVDYYLKALQIAPEDANIRFNLAKTFILSGKFAEAKHEIEALFNNGYIHADYFNLLGFIDLWSKEPELALMSIKEAHGYAKGRPDILLNLGKTLSTLGHYKRADWFLRQSFQRGGEDIIILLSLLENALLEKNPPAIQEYSEKLLKLYPLPAIFEKLTDSHERFKTVPLNSVLLKKHLKHELNLSFLPQ